MAQICSNEHDDTEKVANGLCAFLLGKSFSFIIEIFIMNICLKILFTAFLLFVCPQGTPKSIVSKSFVFDSFCILWKSHFFKV